MRQSRRYPKPWTIEEQPSCFVVKDASGTIIAQVVFCDDEDRRVETGQMSRDEARFVMARIEAQLHDDEPMAVQRLLN